MNNPASTYRKIKMETLKQVAERLGLEEPGVFTLAEMDRRERAPGFIISDLTQAFAIFAVFGQAQFGDTEISEEVDAGELAEDAVIDKLGDMQLLYFKGWTATA